MTLDQIKAIESVINKDTIADWLDADSHSGRLPARFNFSDMELIGELLAPNIKSFFRAKLIAMWEADVERLEGLRRNQENKNGTECGACGESYPAICGCKDINRFIDQEQAHRRAAINSLKSPTNGE